MMTRSLGLILLFVAFNNSSVNAQSLDAPYKNLVHPIDDAKELKGLNSKNDVEAVIEFQTSVKTQGSRGACSIFSATALLEAVLYREGYQKYDLSEEWLEYIAIGSNTSDGSNSYINFSKIKSYGTVSEATWKYDTTNWSKTPSAASEKYCGKLTGDHKKSCLVSHRDYRLLNATDAQLTDDTSELFDPEFAKIKATAQINKTELYDKFLTNASSSIYYTSQVKDLLDRKIPLTMGISFFYGAWNHRLATTYGIGANSTNFRKGIVSNPVRGSVDYMVSTESDKRAGHSIVIVGYDDDVIITANVKMTDGTTKEVNSKGVYYFKNSWGTDKFGSEFEINGVSHKGYGMISQEYVHTQGSFYKLPVNYKQL
jgi:C1A family cysteine protease